MRKTALTFGLASALCSLPVAGRGQVSSPWVLQQPPLSAGPYLQSMAFSGRDTGYAVGSQGAILKTVDGGASWSPLASGTRNFLYGVQFLDGRTGYVVGGYGTLLKTRDGGGTWEPRATGLDSGTISISFPDPRTGYIAGTRGKLLRTVDSGESWSALPIDTLVNPHIWFTTPDTGFIADGETFLRTTNGGKRWTSIPVTGGYVVGLRFFGKDTGFAVGRMIEGPSLILRTTDAGRTWNAQSVDTVGALASVSFINARIGFAGGYGLTVKTTDGGSHWFTVSDKLGSITWDLHFLDENVGYRVGDCGIPKRTSDGGATWSPDVCPTAHDLSAIHFLDRSHGVAVGSEGAMLHTQDGGAHWTQASPFSETSFLEMQFPEPGIGYSVGESSSRAGVFGIVAKTVDGGDTWTPMANSLAQIMAYQSVCFLDAKTGFLSAGGTGTQYTGIYRTTDGGVTWDRKSDLLVASLQFPGRDTGYCVNAGALVKTSDGGNSWTKMPFLPGRDLRSLLFRNSREGFAGTDSGTLLHTADGGESWTVILTGISDTVLAIRFRDARNGLAVGTNGLILATEDGGRTWFRQQAGTTLSLTALDCPDSEICYAAGMGGAILKADFTGSAIRPHSVASAPVIYSGGVLHYVLAEPTRVRMLLFDERGRLVLKWLDATRPAGLLEMPLPAALTRGGPYFLDFQAGASRRALRMDPR